MSELTYLPSARSGVFPEPRGPLIEIAIPVYNEEHVLAASVRRLHSYLMETFPYRFVITVVDNASTDRTWEIATRLSLEIPTVEAVHLTRKGRGRALRHVWGTSSADVVAYMDVDLSTDLDAFLPLIAPLVSGHSDLAIGSRLSRGSAVVRGPRREVISRAYNTLLRVTLLARFSDAQCGFKAGRADVVRALLPAVEDQSWFFDTELLLLAERNGLRIHEVPVDWIDDPDSRVDVLRTAWDDLRGMARMGRRLLSGALRVPVPARARALPAGMRSQVPSFAMIGVVSTVAQLALYALLRLFMPVIAGERRVVPAGGGREHRGEPALHVRGGRARPGRTTSAGGRRGVPARPRGQHGRPRRCPRAVTARASSRRAGRPAGPQPVRRGDPLRAAASVGVPPAARRGAGTRARRRP